MLYKKGFDFAVYTSHPLEFFFNQPQDALKSKVLSLSSLSSSLAFFTRLMKMPLTFWQMIFSISISLAIFFSFMEKEGEIP